VLGLNETQESSLELVFHYADQAGLALLDLEDLRAVVSFLVSDEGKPELKALGGLSSATAGVILRELIGFADQGADLFFGEPEFDRRTRVGAGPSSGRGSSTSSARTRPTRPRRCAPPCGPIPTRRTTWRKCSPSSASARPS
jgi:hypothetical protein